MNIQTLKFKINKRASKISRSAWERGVMKYAVELVESLAEWCEWEETEEVPTGKELKKALLNGADSWSDYSWGGGSLIYNEDIAMRLCTPSELKRTKNGDRRPNAKEEWLDVQARALFQAYCKIVEEMTK